MLQIHKQSENSDAYQVHWLMFGLFIDCSLGQAAKHEPSTLTFRLQTADSGVTTAMAYFISLL